MKTLKLDYIVESIDGKLIQSNTDIKINGVSIDSRTINPGELFFAIIGEKKDGHNYIDNAIENGATAVVVDRRVEASKNTTVIMVKDTTHALQELARSYRQLLKKLKVVAITGSAGKTSTKDMIASLLQEKYITKKTSGNLNNYYGLPLTILDFNGDEEVAVLEMGMSALGEIELLSSIAQPDIAVITNVGETHLETLGSIENVAKGKSELIAALGNDGIAVLNYDNDYVREMKKVFNGKEIVYYGLSSEADIFADEIINVSSSINFSIHYQGDNIKLNIDRPGKHNLYNALSAVAVARVLNLSWENIKEGFSKVEYSALRWDVKKSDNGITIINDTYNANPLSMQAVIETVCSMEGDRIVLALGAMLELGDREKEAHLELGQYLKDKHIYKLLTVGKIASIIADGAENAGMEVNKVKRVKNNEYAISYLKDYLKPGDILLVKGSRANRMEEIVKRLMD